MPTCSSSPQSPRIVEMKIRVGSGWLQGTDQTLCLLFSPITPFYLNLRVLRAKKPPFAHTWSPEIGSDFHSSPLLLSWFQRREWVEGSVAGTAPEPRAPLLCNLMSSLFHACFSEGIKNSFLEDQSVRETEDPLQSSLWLSIPHF